MDTPGLTDAHTIPRVAHASLAQHLLGQTLHPKCFDYQDSKKPLNKLATKPISLSDGSPFRDLFRVSLTVNAAVFGSMSDYYLGRVAPQATPKICKALVQPSNSRRAFPLLYGTQG